MPVVIRELVIRAVVPEGQPQPAEPAADAAATAELVAACVREVLDVLRRREER